MLPRIVKLMTGHVHTLTESQADKSMLGTEGKTHMRSNISRQKVVAPSQHAMVDSPQHLVTSCYRRRSLETVNS